MRQWICLVGISIGVVIVVLEERKAEDEEIFCLAVRACWWGGEYHRTITIQQILVLDLLPRQSPAVPVL